jgi:hypothetical protein
MSSVVVLALLFSMIALSVSSMVETPVPSKQDGYLAPVTYLDLLGDGPNGYTVNLHANHTLDQHFQFIGQDLSNSYFFRQELFGYTALIDNKLRDEKIRRDLGLRWIETDLEMLDLVMCDSWEDLCEKTGTSCNSTLYTNLDPDWREHSTPPPPGNLA